MEEEAITRLKYLLFIYREDDSNEFKLTGILFRNDLEAIETVLNMLIEKDAKIEHLEEKRNNQKTELAILNEKQKDMNKLINDVKSYKGQFKRQEKQIRELQKENEEKDKYIKHSEEITTEMNEDINKLLIEIKEKDKQIDLMLDKIDMTKPSPCTMTNEYSIGRVYMSKEEKKQYFEKLAKEEGE